MDSEISHEYKGFDHNLAKNRQNTIPRVEFSTVNGEKGIAIGEEELWLAFVFLDACEHEGVSVRLYDIRGSISPLTAWISVENPEKLRNSPNAKVLREVLKEEYGEAWRRVLEAVIGLLQEHVRERREECEEILAKMTEEDEYEEYEDVGDPDTAEELLRDPAFLHYIREVMERGVEADRYRFVLGEEDKKLLTYLIALSAKSKWPQSLWVTGDPGFGKSNMVKVALHLMPEGYAKERAYITPGGLRHGDQDYRVLFVEEWRSSLEQDVRLLSAEDGGYCFEIAVKVGDVWETQVVEIPAKTIITTSADRLPSPQLFRRCWVLSVDESEERTKAINLQKALYRSGEIKPTDPEFVKVLRDCVKLLDPELDVLIPYAEALVDVADWDRTRLGHLFDLISIVAWLHQYQRPRDEEGRVIALPQDLYIALRLGWRTLMQSLLKLPERLRRVYELLPSDVDGPGKTARELALELGLSQDTVREYLRDLRAMGHAVCDEGRPKQWWRRIMWENGESTFPDSKWEKIVSLSEKALERASPGNMGDRGEGCLVEYNDGRVAFECIDPIDGSYIVFDPSPRSPILHEEAEIEAEEEKEAETGEIETGNMDSPFSHIIQTEASKPTLQERLQAYSELCSFLDDGDGFTLEVFAEASTLEASEAERILRLLERDKRIYVVGTRRWRSASPAGSLRPHCWGCGVKLEGDFTLDPTTLRYYCPDCLRREVRKNE